MVLLDVDNGPGWLAASANAALYQAEGVRASLQAVRAGGVLAVWSPAPSAALDRALAAQATELEAVDTAAEGRACREPGSTIYVAKP
jgi:hypothetical protein